MYQRLRVYITGKPGVGKTTLLLKVVNGLTKKGVSVSGFYCPEVREGDKRVGFKIKSIDGEIEDWLATIHGSSTVKVGKYNVTVKEETVRKLENNIISAKVIAIDEIGPMELSISSLRNLINRIIQGDHNIIAVVHRKVPIKEGKIYTVTYDNRDGLWKDIIDYISNFLFSSK